MAGSNPRATMESSRGQQSSAGTRARSGSLVPHRGAAVTAMYRRCLRASAFAMETHVLSHGNEKEVCVMREARKLTCVLAASIVLGIVAVCDVGRSFGAGTPEETVKTYLAAMKDQKFDEAYKQISKGMAANKDAEAWAKEQKYIFQT